MHHTNLTPILRAEADDIPAVGLLSLTGNGPDIIRRRRRQLLGSVRPVPSFRRRT